MSVRPPQTMPDFCNRHHPQHYITALHMLMLRGVDIADVRLLAVGEFENYRGEILSQTPPAAEELTRDTQITLSIGCYSSADLLPYQCFYGLTEMRSVDHDWDLQSRQLMAPFDSAVIRLDALAQLERHLLRLSFLNRDQIQRFLELFEFSLDSPHRDMEELVFWASALPSHYLWAGNPVAVAAVLKRLLGYQIEIVENVASECAVPETYRSPLGSENSRLGERFILGSLFSDCDSCYEVLVHDVRPADVVRFLPGGESRRRLEWVLDTCMPSHLVYNVRVQPASKSTFLGAGENPCYLGYSTYA